MVPLCTHAEKVLNFTKIKACNRNPTIEADSYPTHWMIHMWWMGVSPRFLQLFNMQMVIAEKAVRGKLLMTTLSIRQCTTHNKSSTATNANSPQKLFGFRRKPKM